MIGRLLKIAVNEFLRNRHARTGSGPRRMPPTSANEFGRRAAQSVIRMILNRFMRR